MDKLAAPVISAIAADEAAPDEASPASPERKEKVHNPASAGGKHAAADHDALSQEPRKKHKGNSGEASSERSVSKSANQANFVDVAADQGLKTGDRIEVKWTIVMGGPEEEDANASSNQESASRERRSLDRGSVTTWWAATLCAPVGRTHTFLPDGDCSCEEQEVPIEVPIYKLDYDPLVKYGYLERSLEEIAFISGQTILDISTDNVMTFRREGHPSPPPTPAAENIKDMDNIATHFSNEDEIRSFMTSIMQSSLERTGLGKRMQSLPASNQLVMAEKITKAKDQLFEGIMAEMMKMERGDRVLTGDIVKKCVGEMSVRH